MTPASFTNALEFAQAASPVRAISDDELRQIDGATRAAVINNIWSSDIGIPEQVNATQRLFDTYAPSPSRQRENYDSTRDFLYSMADAVRRLGQSAVAQGMNLWSSLKNAPRAVLNWVAQAANILSANALGVRKADLDFDTVPDDSTEIANYSPKDNRITVHSNQVDTVADLVTAIYHENMHNEQHVIMRSDRMDGDARMLRAANKLYWMTSEGGRFYRNNPQEAEAFVAYNRLRRALGVSTL